VVTPPETPSLKLATIEPKAGAEKPAKLEKAFKPEKKLLVKTILQQTTTKTTVTTTPASTAQPLDGYNRIYQSAKKRTPAQRDSVVRLVGIIKQDVSNGSPTRALKRLSSDKAVPYLDPVEKDQLQTLVARGYLLAGKIVQSYELASESAQRSGTKIPQAGWVAGLAAWRMGNYDQSAKMFSISADSAYSSPWQASASSYWASRSYMRAHKPQEVSVWLERAAAYPRTFYGLIATRSLGWDYDFNWDVPSLTSAHRKALEANPTAREGIELAKAGRKHDAEAMLAKIDTSNDPLLRDALIAFAASKELSSFGMQLAMTQPHPKGGYYDAALYPLSPWKPRDGYTVDRALVHAIIRQESKFNPGAVSRSGAQGLMQVMPSTASYISGKSHFKNKDSHAKLRDPQTNLDLGQRYITKLLYQDHVDTELFSLVMAYNAGPGNLKKWKRELADMQDDPLLFIESIPMGETRAYVERVMSNYWIYRMRMNQPVPSLDAVAEGQWAQYIPIDGVKQAGIPVPEMLRLATTN
jgi:soluble lytic murein transglycosylase-like protein